MDLWKPVRSYTELHYYRVYTQQFRHQLEVAYGVSDADFRSLGDFGSLEVGGSGLGGKDKRFWA